MTLICAAVRTGTKYSTGYVLRLMAGLERHLRVPFEFHLFTDRPDEVVNGINQVHDISHLGLQGWWGKMALFEPSWRAGRKVLYMDLDSVITGDLRPLADLAVDFGICGNFTRASGNKAYPCRYGSCTMILGPDARTDVWPRFVKDRLELMDRAGQYGDQKVIEELVPDATILQEVLPAGFFHGYRNLKDSKPDGCSVVVFAGTHKPHNTDFDWVKEAWLR